MSRKIIHLDLDAFFCAVEELTHPELKGKPFAVGGKPDERGVISSSSYAARLKGVRSAMPSARALKLCSELTILSGNHKAYYESSHQVMNILNDLTPLVEQISIDEAFMDVSDLQEPTREIGSRLQKRINQELNLPCSLGIATNKLVAKIATDYGKLSHHEPFPPNVIYEVLPGTEKQFLAPLPVTNLWGIGAKTASVLSGVGIKTIGDILNFPEKDLINLLGKTGTDIYRHAQGIDNRPIIMTHEAKSISQETTFIKDVTDFELLKDTLHRLSCKVGSRLRKEGICCSTIKLKIRWSDFSTITHQQTLLSPVDEDQVIFETGLSLLQEVLKKPRPIRLLGIGLSNFQEPTYQMDFWQNSSGKRKQLQKAVDELKDRCGNRTIQRGYEFKRQSKHDETKPE